MTPLLILLFGIHPATAVGTDLLFAAATKTAGTVVHGFNRHVDWRIVGKLAIGSVTSAAITLYVLSQLGGSDPGVARLLATILGVMLVLTALSLIFRNRLFGFARSHRELSPRTQTAITIGRRTARRTGVDLIGRRRRHRRHRADAALPAPVAGRIVASDIAHAVPLTLVAGLGHWAIGNVEWGMLASLLVGSIPGILIASYLCRRVPETVLRLVLASGSDSGRRQAWLQ